MKVGRIFPTPEELGEPPISPHDGDLSRIVVIAADSQEEYERIHAALQSLYAERRAARAAEDGPRSAQATKAIIAYLNRLEKESDNGETDQAERHDQAA